MTLDDIINKAIPIDPNTCRIKRAKKEALRLETKRALLVFISKNFTPKPDENTNRAK